MPSDTSSTPYARRQAQHAALDALGAVADDLDSLWHAQELPLPPAMHLEQTHAALHRYAQRLKAAYRQLSGTNPWQDVPCVRTVGWKPKENPMLSDTLVPDVPTLPMIEIRHRWRGHVLFSLACGSLRLAVEAAVSADANLTGADLTGADLQPIRDDLWAVLCGAPAEVPGLRQALLEGRIDGSTYSGPCACLVGTRANVRGCPIEELTLIQPNSARLSERWFTNLRPGDTPATSHVAAITLEWVDIWLDAMRAAFGAVAQGEG